ncbi:helix-turn-helix domain-containing protein [Cobetia sp. MC34]|uniref:helix-turn-helix domain-containing protein n=1 Tax=Cobetia sp. MC34 TaxID=2785080 RepID=UPI001BC94AE7|nr:helix-turn-helix domain-containing protein [Cobetia sp. MC34]MBS4153302.1 helix-turn-helix domain-containing protein [Cobetia sp. MC34]|tara:strand:+ start:1301 stop:1966 length:666 start_codon:yes stop_codon:yes gene_type:complete
MANQRVEAVERALTLLEAFTPATPRLTLNELAQASGFYKSTILRLMGSLEHFGYVARDSHGIYSIGAALGRFAQLAPALPAREAQLRGWLAALNAASGETASLMLVEHGPLAEARPVAGVTRPRQAMCQYAHVSQWPLRHQLEEGELVDEALSVLLQQCVDSGEIETGEAAGLSVAALAISVAQHHDEGLAPAEVIVLSGPTARLTPAQAHRLLAQWQQGD